MEGKKTAETSNCLEERETHTWPFQNNFVLIKVPNHNSDISHLYPWVCITEDFSNSRLHVCVHYGCELWFTNVRTNTNCVHVLGAVKLLFCLPSLMATITFPSRSASASPFLRTQQSLLYVPDRLSDVKEVNRTRHQKPGEMWCFRYFCKPFPTPSHIPQLMSLGLFTKGSAE